MLKNSPFCGKIILRRLERTAKTDMASPVGDKRAVKIFVLYLLENIGYPMELCTVSDIVMKSDYVLYLDFAEAFNEMLDAGLIEEVSPPGSLEGGENDGPGAGAPSGPFYAVSAKGRVVAEGLRSDILPSILDKALAAAMKYLDFTRRGISAECDITGAAGGGYDIRCRLTEKKRTLMSVDLHVDSMNRAVRMKKVFEERPEVVFRGVNALLSGNVSFLGGE